MATLPLLAAAALTSGGLALATAGPAAAAGAAFPAHFAAPYLQVSSSDVGDLQADLSATGLKYYTLAFLTPSSSSSCTPTWEDGGEAMKRALRSLRQLLGETSLENLGDWVTHPEALGTRVRMMRVTRVPIDAYRYIVDSARETTRIGTWEIEEGILGSAGESGTLASGGDGGGACHPCRPPHGARSLKHAWKRLESSTKNRPRKEERGPP